MSKKHGEDSKRKLKNNITNDVPRRSLTVNDASTNGLKRPLTSDNISGGKKKKLRTTINSSGKQEGSNEDNNIEKQSQNSNKTRKNGNTKSKSETIGVNNNPKNPIANTVKKNICNVIGKRKKKEICNTSSIKKTSSKTNGTDSVEPNKNEIENTSSIKKLPFKINGIESIGNNKKEIGSASGIKKTPSKKNENESIGNNKKEIGSASGIKKTPSKKNENDSAENTKKEICSASDIKKNPSNENENESDKYNEKEICSASDIKKTPSKKNENNEKEICSASGIKKTPPKKNENESVVHNEKEIGSASSIKTTPSKINENESNTHNETEIGSASSIKKTPSKINENESVDNSEIIDDEDSLINKAVISFNLLGVDIHNPSEMSTTSVVKSPVETNDLNKTNIENSKDDSVLNNDKSGTTMLDSFNNESIIVTDSSTNMDFSILATESSKNIKPSLVSELCENSNSSKVTELSVGTSSTETEITKNIEASTEVEITNNMVASTETDSFYHNNDPIVIVVPNKLNANVSPEINKLTDQVGKNDIEIIDLDNSNDTWDAYPANYSQTMEDCINALRKKDSTVFPQIINLFATKQGGFEQFDGICTMKILEYMSDRYTPGEMRSKYQEIKNREQLWKMKYLSLKKQMRELRAVIKRHNYETKLNIPNCKPHKVNRTVGLQAVIGSNEKNTMSNSTEISVDSSIETIDITIDESDTVIDTTNKDISTEFCGDNGGDGGDNLPVEDLADSDDVLSFSELSTDIPSTTKMAFKDMPSTSNILNNMSTTSKKFTDMIASTSKTLTGMKPSTSKTLTILMPSTSKTLTIMKPPLLKPLSDMGQSTSKALTDMGQSTTKTLTIMMPPAPKTGMMASTSKTLNDGMIPSTSKTLIDEVKSSTSKIVQQSLSGIRLAPVLLKKAISPAIVPINSINNVIINNSSTIDLTSDDGSDLSNGYTLKKFPIKTVQVSRSPSKQLSTNVSSQVVPTSLSYFELSQTPSIIVRTTTTGAKVSTVTSLNTPKQAMVYNHGRVLSVPISPLQVQSTNVTYSTLQLPSQHNGTMKSVQTQHNRRLHPSVTSKHNRQLQPVPPAIPIVNTEHPAPLPPIPHQRSLPTWKKLPPSPKVTITNTTQTSRALVLSWNMPAMNNKIFATVNSYQIFAYHELENEPARTELWKKIGDVNALPLPMACSLTQFKPGEKYHFAIRAVDSYHRTGPFSEPQHMFLF